MRERLHRYLPSKTISFQFTGCCVCSASCSGSQSDLRVLATKLGVKAPDATTKCRKEPKRETSTERLKRRQARSSGFPSPRRRACRQMDENDLKPPHVCVSTRERIQTRVQTLVYPHLRSIGACALVRLLC